MFKTLLYTVGLVSAGKPPADTLTPLPSFPTAKRSPIKRKPACRPVASPLVAVASSARNRGKGAAGAPAHAGSRHAETPDKAGAQDDSIEAEETESAGKRKRGRPPTTALAPQAPTPAADAAEDAPAKRKRGRPSKAAAAAIGSHASATAAPAAPAKPEALIAPKAGISSFFKPSGGAKKAQSKTAVPTVAGNNAADDGARADVTQQPDKKPGQGALDNAAATATSVSGVLAQADSGAKRGRSVLFFDDFDLLLEEDPGFLASVATLLDGSKACINCIISVSLCTSRRHIATTILVISCAVHLTNIAA